LAERFFAEDANTSLIKSRQFGEYMLKEIAALSGVYDPTARETTSELLRRLTTQQVLPREVADVFHAVRKSGNAAAHGLGAQARRALALVGRLDEAILAKAFRGELSPQDDNDEPAEKLLERIRGERRRRNGDGGGWRDYAV
jgi:hypothetical protein